ncbi:hypothetical protein SAMN02910358_00697 [Lachnospiraceae bacterium XBB1006]|nr:hypothetical protein SAMN02910358_00697 [Lachnospiraceae bacterium XBB1006]
MEQERKTVKKLFLMTEREATLLHEKAEEKSMSEGAYVRFLLSQKPNDYPEIRLLMKELINEINKISVGVNQIIKRDDCEGYREEDKERLIAYLKKVTRLMQEVIGKLGDK